MAVKLDNGRIRELLATLGYTAPKGQLCILGVRGMVPYKHPGEKGVWLSLADNRPNEYNDSLVLFGTSLRAYLGSVDPGKTFTLNPTNVNGCAHLENGHYRYKIGTHRRVHRALVQAEKVRVRRDTDRDGKAEPGEFVDEGFFGINIHAGGAGKEIGSWSAGCQIVKGGWEGPEWKSFFAQVEAARQPVYHYFLIDGSQLARFVDGPANG